MTAEMHQRACGLPGPRHGTIDGVTWAVVLGVIVVLSVIVVLAVMRGEQMRPAYDDRPDVVVPADRPLRSEDLASIRFTTAIRGYRMSEVDALLDRLRAELAERERGPVERRPDDVTG